MAQQETQKQDVRIEQNQQLEQNQKEQPMPVIAKVLIIGVVGGIFWSMLAYCAYFFHFTELSPSLVLQPWAIGEWKDGAIGNIISFLVIGLLSILVALLYYALLKKRQGIWPGIIFGVILWLVVFYALNPIFPQLKAVKELERNTIITTICFYILYGVFIGYSISFEVTEMRRQKQAE
ncbi:membrane protein YqhR [Thermolongibacillus altinsuensis]|uniref:Membrane protein YqhR n=1 Tax=Thermolongibacillus altinsuensis TaxID=575256 RepID=A0A4R1QE73_9BACL|nr:YqhR family membrane protein [Thermolongibacillus altinsuensis]TCL48777.1 membrane protein YqhR [Thermolongibacillus altinsuensis]